MKLLIKKYKLLIFGLVLFVILLVGVISSGKNRASLNQSEEANTVPNEQVATDVSAISSPDLETNHEDYEEPASTGGSHVVEIKNSKFEPVVLTIKVNDTVGFENYDDTLHKIKSDNPTFGTNPLEKNQTQYVVTYTEIGTYYYYLENNPAVKGTIVVAN